MKAKLIKTEDEHGIMYCLSGNDLPENYVLSQQNCDELFGVVDVEKLAKEEFPYDFDSPLFETIGVIEKVNKSILIGMLQGTFIKGFNKAIELNKVKVFAIPEVIKLCTNYYKIGLVEAAGIPQEKRAVLPKEIIEDLKFLRPTEIEVEIVMEEVQEIYRDSTVKWESVPKLDFNGHLILKKI